MAEKKSRPASARIKVRTVKPGFYNNERKRVGDVFVLNKEKDFSEKWMVRVDASTPTNRSSSRTALQRHLAEIDAARASEKPTEGDGDEPTGDQEVI